jgi:hypothetical protein
MVDQIIVSPEQNVTLDMQSGVSGDWHRIGTFGYKGWAVTIGQTLLEQDRASTSSEWCGFRVLPVAGRDLNYNDVSNMVSRVVQEHVRITGRSSEWITGPVTLTGGITCAIMDLIDPGWADKD